MILRPPRSTQSGSSAASDVYKRQGYVGLGYFRPGKQKLIAVAKDADGPFVKPDIVTAVSGLYPIARPLYWYTNGQPRGEVSSLLDFVLSDEGQSIVDKAGFAPIRKGQAL